MKSIVAVSPFDCRMWDLHDRFDCQVNETSCRAEIESFSKHGQLVAALGRPLQGDPEYKVELIYGARRLFVARYLNRPLLVEMSNLSDREAIIAMDIENRHRIDISPYERGMSYAKWLRSGHFSSQEEIARSLHVSASQVSRLLKLSQLPTVVVDAFGSVANICEGWGLEIMSSLEDPYKRQRTIRVARELCRRTPRPPAREVLRQLLAAPVSGPKVRAAAHDEIVKDSRGIPLFRIRQQRNSISLLLPIEKVSALSLEKVRRALCCILQDANGPKLAAASEQETRVPV